LKYCLYTFLMGTQCLFHTLFNSNFSFGKSFIFAFNFPVLNKVKQGIIKTGNVNRLIKFENLFFKDCKDCVNTIFKIKCVKPVEEESGADKLDCKAINDCFESIVFQCWKRLPMLKTSSYAENVIIFWKRHYMLKTSLKCWKRY